MAFIDPANIEALQALHPGQFALPPYAEAPAILADTTRLRGSVKAMRTTLTNKGFGEIAQEIAATHDGQLPQRMEQLHESILGEMRGLLGAPVAQDAGNLSRCFHLVQLWGGRAGRGIYVQGDGFAGNFNTDAYRRFARTAANGDNLSLDQRTKGLESNAEEIKHFGVSFATKHARFWAEAAEAPPLPIYDTIMAQGCLGHRSANWDHYFNYVEEMTRHADEAGVSVQALERHAFNFFGSTAGENWVGLRKMR